MPEWMRPTGAFGIGMHTIFSVTDHFKLKTKSDREPYGNTIYLYSGKNGGHVFCEKGEKISRGTIVEFEMDFSDEEYQDFIQEGSEGDYLKNTGGVFVGKV
jgi:HSP90 family molecular chaperone